MYYKNVRGAHITCRAAGLESLVCSVAVLAGELELRLFVCLFVCPIKIFRFQIGAEIVLFVPNSDRCFLPSGLPHCGHWAGIGLSRG
jgi:hypothetical protein